MSRWSYAALGAVPLLAGALLSVPAVMDGPLLCPFQAVTGLPCPLCGATRAFVLFGHGDGRWVDYGAVWIVVALMLLVIALTRWRPRALLIVPVGVVAWAWALLNAGTITS